MKNNDADVFMNSYTNLLWVLSGLFALPLFSTLLVLIGAAEESIRPPWVVVLTTGVSLACIGVAAARVARSKAAPGLTLVLSWVFLFFVPIGTVVWAYWFFAVRVRERQGGKRL